MAQRPEDVHGTEVMEEKLALKTSMEFAYGTAQPMSPGVVRVVANNPGPFTFRGTNTYLVGTASLAVIDPGPDDPDHIKAVVAATGGRPVSHILITHAHRDHIDGAGLLKAATGAPTYAYGRRGGSAPDIGPAGKRYVNDEYAADHDIKHGDHLTGDDFDLEVIHTPGHAPDHVCFALAGRKLLFSGDHVMAWNTSVVAPPEGRMADYIASLELLMTRQDKLYCPGHGGRLEEPQRMVKAFLIHRRTRENSILEAIKNGKSAIEDIVPLIYPELSAPLRTAAALSVQAHVEHLIQRGLVVSASKASSSGLSPA
jgi:glyoxylase-like metal-dependent hydrolase (beta-lactamase superfamily II)